MINRGKFIIFLLILSFDFIEGDKDKNLGKLKKLWTDKEKSDNIHHSYNIEHSDDIIKEADKGDTSDDIKKNYLISQADDIPLPKTYILGFTNYEFYENPYKFKYDIILRLADYPNNEIDNITMKVNISTSTLNSEVEEVTCVKSRSNSICVYRFICSKKVSKPISQISYFDNNIILNGEIPLNSSISALAKYFGKNIQNQTNYPFSISLPSLPYEEYNSWTPHEDFIFFTNCYIYGENNKLIFEGEADGSTINSKNSTLSFIQVENVKNIFCKINDKGNNRFKMVCKPDFNVNANLDGNNMVYMDDLGKIGMMTFEKGKSLAYLDVISKSKVIIKSSNEGKSKILIIAIIFLFIGLLVIIIIVILCKIKLDSKQTNLENKENSQPSQNNISFPSTDSKQNTNNP